LRLSRKDRKPKKNKKQKEKNEIFNKIIYGKGGEKKSGKYCFGREKHLTVR
jgi:hypothetical protein